MVQKVIWNEEKIEQLRQLIERRVSLARAAVILKCRQSSVQIQARKLGKPFPGVRETKARLKSRIAEAETQAGIRR